MLPSARNHPHRGQRHSTAQHLHSGLGHCSTMKRPRQVSLLRRQQRLSTTHRRQVPRQSQHPPGLRMPQAVRQFHRKSRTFQGYQQVQLKPLSLLLLNSQAHRPTPTRAPSMSTTTSGCQKTFRPCMMTSRSPHRKCLTSILTRPTSGPN